MSFLSELTKEQIELEEVPIKQLLEDSCFYPACQFDGGVIKHLGNQVQHFVYCDYQVSRAELLSKLNGFLGYHVLATRSLSLDAVPSVHFPTLLPPDFDRATYFKQKDHYKGNYLQWVVLERKEEFGSEHGPERFSLLYVGGEAIATYQALYVHFRIKPKVVAFIVDGAGFGGNWTGFAERDGPMAWSLAQNPAGMPDYILHDFLRGDQPSTDWEAYVVDSIINSYSVKRGDYIDTYPVGVWRNREVEHYLHPQNSKPVP